jgi:hypothetical protein
MFPDRNAYTKKSACNSTNAETKKVFERNKLRISSQGELLTKRIKKNELFVQWPTTNNQQLFYVCLQKFYFNDQ